MSKIAVDLHMNDLSNLNIHSQNLFDTKKSIEVSYSVLLLTPCELARVTQSHRQMDSLTYGELLEEHQAAARRLRTD